MTGSMQNTDENKILTGIAINNPVMKYAKATLAFRHKPDSNDKSKM